MFVKRARPRPSLRARDTDLADSPAESTSSPLAKGSFTVDDAQNADLSMDMDPDESSGSLMGRKKGLQKKDKTKSKLGKKAAVLSFGGEEEEEQVFKPEKSKLSHMLKMSKAPGVDLMSTPGSPVPSSSSIYSREYLSELKAATPTRAPQNATDNIEDAEHVDASGVSRLARDKYAANFAQDTTAGIPDAAVIAAAKMKRQAGLGANDAGAGTRADDGEEDFISLSDRGGGGRIAIYDPDQGPHPESRLVREEDEEGEGDEDLAQYTGAADKLYLGKNANKTAARRLRGEIDDLIADREADDEDDEETLEWERAQAERSGMYKDEKPTRALQKPYAPAPIPIVKPLPTISSAQNRLALALSELAITKSENEHNLNVVVQELSDLEAQERALRVEVERVESKREYMAEFRAWVEMLGDFLEEKYPKLESIESDAIHHLQERSLTIATRREADDCDDLSLFLGVAAPREDEQEVDEHGRERDATRKFGPSSSIRAGRREARSKRRFKRHSKISSSPPEEEGFSTDSTLADADAEDYDAAQHKLTYRTYALMDDVKAEDFRDPEKGLAVRFGGWRKRDEEEYVNAYGGLALVQAWEFWARGEMVGWEPLRDSSSLESFKWFQALHRYCHPPQARHHNDDDDDMEQEPPLGPEGDLVASMVSTSVVPLLTKMFEAGAYDVYSAAQTRKAVALMDMVADSSGKDSRKFTALLKAILGVFHTHLLSLSSTISSVTSPSAIPPPAFDPASRPAMQRYVQRRIKLLKNMLMWKREAPQEVSELVVRLVGEVLRPILARTWEGGGKEMAQKVLEAAAGSLSPDLVGFLTQGPNSKW